MKTRKAILVDDPSIGNDEAIARLAALADTGEVTVLATPGEVPNLRVGTGVELEELLRNEGQRRADEIVEQLGKKGINASAKVRLGVRPIEIIREVTESEADYVVKVGEDPRGSASGSTDPHLLRKCPCPVLIVRPRERLPYKRVFAAIDPQDEMPGRDANLDERILEWAVEICRADQAQLTVLNVWEKADEGLLLGREHLPAAEVKRLASQAKADHKLRIERLMAKHDLSGIEHSLQLTKGQPAEVIPASVYRGRGDLLVMGTVARTGIAGFFIGNTAERIIPQLSCAILAVKPAGFTSPVSGA